MEQEAAANAATLIAGASRGALTDHVTAPSSAPHSAVAVPGEVLGHVFSLLDAVSLSQCGRVCRQWRRLAGGGDAAQHAQPQRLWAAQCVLGWHEWNHWLGSHSGGGVRRTSASQPASTAPHLLSLLGRVRSPCQPADAAGLAAPVPGTGVDASKAAATAGWECLPGCVAQGTWWHPLLARVQRLASAGGGTRGARCHQARLHAIVVQLLRHGARRAYVRRRSRDRLALRLLDTMVRRPTERQAALGTIVCTLGDDVLEVLVRARDAAVVHRRMDVEYYASMAIERVVERRMASAVSRAASVSSSAAVNADVILRLARARSLRR